MGSWLATHGRYIATTLQLQDVVTLKIGFHKNFQTNNFRIELAVQNINNQITVDSKTLLSLKLVLMHVVDWVIRSFHF